MRASWFSRDPKAKAERLQAAYANRRAAWREQWPNRKFELTGNEPYLAPPDLRVRVAGASDG